MVALKEATEIVLSNMPKSVYILGCEDGKNMFGFYTLLRGIKYEPGKSYIMDSVYTVDKKTGKFGWMDTIKFVATQGHRKRTRRGIEMNLLDISEYLPDDCKEAAKQWYNL